MPPVILPVLLLLLINSWTLRSQEEMGSSLANRLITIGGGSPSVANLGNTSVRDRDFRLSALLSDMTTTPNYNSANINTNINNLFETGASFFMINNFLPNKNIIYRRKTKLKDINWINNGNPDVLFSRIRRDDDEEDDNEEEGSDNEEDIPWIDTELDKKEKYVQMHAFIVRDENIPECDVSAEKFTKTRYFMCTGVIISHNRILTSASCINSAEIHEYHIEANLAVLVGSLTEESYVIKIDYYEFHPKYIPDPQSINYEKYNIAMIALSCSIPNRLLIIPKLPTRYYDDVGHICCPNRCKLLTVVQTSQNYHFVREMETKHLPAPIHDDVNLYQAKTFPVNVEIINLKPKDLLPYRPLKRKFREPGVAPAPEFFTQDMANKIKLTRLKNNTKIDFQVALRQAESNGNEESGSSTTESSTSEKDGSELASTEPSTTEKGGLASVSIESSTSEQDGSESASTEPSTTEQQGGSASVSIESSTTDKSRSGSASTEPATTEQNESESTSTNSSTVENGTNSTNSKNITLEKYYDCPPLGSPIIRNNTLIALIAYTCDDIQNWVKWKYVDISRNIEWIKLVLRKASKKEMKDE